MKTRRYKGHGVQAIYINIILAVIPALLVFFASTRPSEEVEVFRLFLALEMAWFMPFPAYLFFEIKHLLFKDGVADGRSFESILVFGGQSLLGFCLQVYVIWQVIQLELYGPPSLALLVILPLVTSFGACLGLTDLPLLYIIFPDKVIEHSLIVLKSWKLILVWLVTAFLLFVTTFQLISL